MQIRLFGTTVMMFLVLGSACASSAATVPAVKSHRFNCRFLARGTAIYSSFSGNQSEFLLEIKEDDNKTYFARLLYRQPPSHPEIPDTLIDSGKMLRFQLTRSAECDEPYATLTTAWMPGPYGTLRAVDSLRFVVGASRPLITGEEVVPCYLLNPRSVKWHRGQVEVD